EAQIAYQLAQCYTEAENWEQAAEYLSQTLDSIEHTGGDIDPVDVRVDLGLAYKAMGKLKRALATFQEVDAQNANYRGVKAEIQSLKKQLGEGGDEPPDNISFV
ncbi:MAG: tetratricopeptide repeat protein, partial [Deltaproteobacteria bacterium]|nr:tetratricopeptide repeat protein [Deltaproteobacteria bacterium]